AISLPVKRIFMRARNGGSPDVRREGIRIFDSKVSAVVDGPSWPVFDWRLPIGRSASGAPLWARPPSPDHPSHGQASKSRLSTKASLLESATPSQGLLFHQ